MVPEPLLDGVNLGALVLAEAPRWLRRIRLHRPLLDMAHDAEVSSATLLQWMEPTAGTPHAPWSAQGPLYPFPLDLWDAWAARHRPGQASALHRPDLSIEEGLLDRLHRWRSGPITLSALDLPRILSDERFQGRRVPDSTLREANGPCPYPYSWRALDHLAKEDSFFLISLLRFSREIGMRLPIHKEIAAAVLATRLDSALRPG